MKKFIINVAYNMLATFLPICVIQLIIYPYLNKQLGNDTYGGLITVVSAMNVVSTACGSAISNIRLVKHVAYKEKKLTGDFSLLAALLSMAGFLMMIIWSFFSAFSPAEMVLFGILTAFMILKLYLEVEFRLQQDFKYICMSNFMLILGFGAGLLFFVLLNRQTKIAYSWTIIYLMGYLFGLLYLFRKNQLFRKEWGRTVWFKRTAKETSVMSISLLIANLINYLDILFIYPALGAETVSVYYISTLLGKIISMGIGPVTGLILSYLSKEKELPYRILKKTIGLTILLEILGYAAIILFCEPVLKILYPFIYKKAIPYIYINTITVMLGILVTIARPFIIKFFSVYLQMGINVGVVLTYAVIAFFMTRQWHLPGFCIATLFINLFQFLIYGILIHKTEKRRKKSYETAPD